MRVPEAVADLFTGPPAIGTPAQAFPFLTVDDALAPHCCLLSTTEIAVAPDRREIYVALASRRTRSHLEARGRATLLAVEGTTLHSCKLGLRAGAEHEGVLGAALELLDHDGDTLGIELTPLGFTPPPGIARIERWDATAAALDMVRRMRR